MWSAVETGAAALAESAGAWNLPSSLSSMSFKNSSFVVDLIKASLKSGSIIMVANLDKIIKCSSLPPSGAAIAKNRRAGLPSID